MNETVVTERMHESALVLANLGELGVQLVKKIAGNDVSTAVNGSVLTREVMQNLIQRAVVKRSLPQ